MSLRKMILQCSAIMVLGITCAWSLSGTGGAPLGGVGTGYVLFNAASGNIAALTKVMPPASYGKSEFVDYQSSSCGLHFFVSGGTPSYKLKNSTANENVVLPILSAIFPPVGGVTFADTSFGPIVSGQAYDTLVHSPLAFSMSPRATRMISYAP